MKEYVVAHLEVYTRELIVLADSWEEAVHKVALKHANGDTKNIIDGGSEFLEIDCSDVNVYDRDDASEPVGTVNGEEFLRMIEEAEK